MDPTKPFRELRDRKLWPIALLLVLALVAVPLLLSRDAQSTGPAPAVASASGELEPVVDADDPARRDAARTVLGKEKDPFRAAATPTPTATPKPDGDGGDEADSGSGSSSAGGASGSGASGESSSAGGASPAPAPTAVPTPAPTATPTPQRSFPLQSLEVRFGTVENPDHADRTLSRLSGLPKGDATPALLYLGLKADRKTAVFLVRDGVAVLGDGACRPAKRCERLEMRKGDIEFVGVPGGGQYQVEILRIHDRRTTSAQTARAARTHVFPGGRTFLQTMDADQAGLRYDADTGVLRDR